MKQFFVGACALLLCFSELASAQGDFPAATSLAIVTWPQKVDNGGQVNLTGVFATNSIFTLTAVVPSSDGWIDSQSNVASLTAQSNGTSLSFTLPTKLNVYDEYMEDTGKTIPLTAGVYELVMLDQDAFYPASNSVLIRVLDPVISVVHPNSSGISWTVGEQHRVKWTSAGDSTVSLSLVDVHGNEMPIGTYSGANGFADVIVPSVSDGDYSVKATYLGVSSVGEAFHVTVGSGPSASSLVVVELNPPTVSNQAKTKSAPPGAKLVASPEWFPLKTVKTARSGKNSFSLTGK